jgi:hypothetical protein
LLWGWIKDSHTPPLVTAGPASSAAILNNAGTITLFGGNAIDNEDRIGGQFTVGCWLNSCQTLGIEADYLFLAARSTNFTAGSNGGPGTLAIGRPFFNLTSGMQDSELVAFPGLLSGRVGVNLSSRLQGAELNAVTRACCGCGGRLDLLAGFRYLDLNESLGINENLQVLPGVPTIGGESFLVGDQFATRNRFYGGQVGARAEINQGGWSIGLTAKVALGESEETVDIKGATVTTAPGGVPTVTRGGLLALPSNIGHYSRDAFAVVPEVGITLGYQVNSHMKAYVGYKFLYWSDVARPGDQIDPFLNTTQVPRTGGTPVVGPTHPAFQFRDTDFWAQGINFGVEFRF